MIRPGSLLVLMASVGFLPVTDAAYADRVRDSDYAFVIAIDRSAGLTSPKQTRPMDHYRFTVARNGFWELEPHFKGDAKKGRLDAEELDEWIEDIERGGLDTVESNPDLGAADEPYMDITVNTHETKVRVRIRLAEKLSQAIEDKIVEVVRAGEESDEH